MRAGLIVAGAVALAFSVAESAQAAPAPVPCTNVGNGHYECNWYVPGDGISGGSLVVVGTTTVGYLHQGKNWVVCQQTGGDVRNAAGNRNNWYGWTQADNNKWGWASPLDASGGDDYGAFGGGTPNCNGAHGSPPAYNGVWGSPPTQLPSPPGAPPAPAPGTDADHDGVQPPADCDDFNSRVYPGAPEVPNDGIDQDCNGADAAGRLSAIVSNSFASTRSSTRVARLRVTEAPAGATISVTCSGKRCPKPRTVAANAQGKATLTGMFKRRLRPGARIDVAISAPNTVGKVVRFTIRRGHTPRTQTLCLPPGGKPGRC
jgi:hypothetical protein